jgi:hypothetical protein
LIKRTRASGHFTAAQCKGSHDPPSLNPICPGEGQYPTMPGSTFLAQSGIAYVRLESVRILSPRPIKEPPQAGFFCVR